MKKVLIPLISNFEATELITTINVLKRNNIDYFIWSIEGIDLIHSNREALVIASSIFPQNESFDALFIPGGPGVKELEEYDEIYEIISNFNKSKKIIATICAAPKLLHKIGLLDNKKFTSFPGLKLNNSTGSSVEIDGNIITGRDYSVTQEFAEKLVYSLNKYK